MAVRAINTQKLRRLIAERNRRGDAVRKATDDYLAIRDEIGKLEHFVNSQRVGGREPNPQNEQRLADLKEQSADLQRQREQASRRFDEYAIVDDLIEYARDLGYHIDAITGTITKPVQDKRPGTREGMGINGDKPASPPADPVGLPRGDGGPRGASPIDTSATAYTGGQ